MKKALLSREKFLIFLKIIFKKRLFALALMGE